MKYEIWLGNDSTYFDHGIAHFADGRTEPLGAFCNIGFRQDTLLVGAKNCFGELDDQLRWYILPGVIDFYVWTQELESVIFHNESDRHLYIAGYVYLKPGQSAELQRAPDGTHSYWLRHMSPVGLGRLLETTHTEEEYPELVGKYGLILSRMSKENPWKTVMRFILADCLEGEEPELEGLETSAGNLHYEEGRLVLQTENARYVFSLDKGENHEQ